MKASSNLIIYWVALEDKRVPSSRSPEDGGSSKSYCPMQYDDLCPPETSQIKFKGHASMSKCIREMNNKTITQLHVMFYTKCHIGLKPPMRIYPGNLNIISKDVLSNNRIQPLLGKP